MQLKINIKKKMNNNKIIQNIANKAGISFNKAVVVLRQMSKMKEVQEKLKENNKS